MTTITTKNNVVEFPKSRVVRDIDEMPEVLKFKQKGLKKYADASIQQIASNILEELNNSGIDTSTDAFMKDFYCAAALLQAAVYRSFEFEHPCHQWVDSNQIEVDKALLDNIDHDYLE
jgi:transcriptional regulator NrdR family protein